MGNAPKESVSTTSTPTSKNDLWSSWMTSGRVATRTSLQPSSDGPPKSSGPSPLSWRFVPVAPSKMKRARERGRGSRPRFSQATGHADANSAQDEDHAGSKRSCFVRRRLIVTRGNGEIDAPCREKEINALWIKQTGVVPARGAVRDASVRDERSEATSGASRAVRR